MTAIAESAGVNWRTLKRWTEGDHDDPKLSSLEAVSRALGVPVSELLGEPPPPGDSLNLDGDIDQAVDELVKQTDSDREAVLKQLIIDALRARGHDVGPTRYGRPIRFVDFPEKEMDVVAVAAAGTGRDPQWIPEDTTSIPIAIASRAEERGWRLVRVFGESMSPELEDGDLVFVQPVWKITEAEDFDAVYFVYEGEPQIKRFRRLPGSVRWTLVAVNPAVAFIPPASDSQIKYPAIVRERIPKKR